MSEYINIGRDCIEKTEQSKKIIIFTESGTLCIRNAIYYYICCILRILHREYGDYEFQKVAGPNTTFVGLENYKILKNAVFIKSLKNSIFYTIVTCLLMIPIPMVLAAMLNSKHMRAKGTFRSILFVPALTSVVVAGVVFRLMFGELEGSFMNQVVGLFGIDPIVWLRTPGTVWCTLFSCVCGDGQV